jgi:hypothetical protein
MNEAELRRINPNVSKSVIALNSRPSGSIPEPAVHNGTDGATKRKTKNSGRYVVSVTSYRSRLCDPDNLCAKYFVDALRYAGVIPDDRPDDIIYQIQQKKCSKEKEKTLIEVSI